MSGLHFSDTSAFSPVPLDMYDYFGPGQPNSTNLDLFTPVCDYDSKNLQQALIEQWIANLHQPTYESSLPLNFLPYPYLHEYLGEPGFIRKRNERERMRVRSVNEGYARLRDHLPLEPTEKRLSKVETLRGAIKYIRLLETILKETDINDRNNNNNNNETTRKRKVDHLSEEMSGIERPDSVLDDSSTSVNTEIDANSDSKSIPESPVYIDVEKA